MRILHAALLMAAIALTSFSAVAKEHRTYTEKEIRCVAHALWYEGGSTMGKVLLENPNGAREELRLMAYTIKVRGQTKIPYNKKDWGSPNLCDVINKPGQYSYTKTKHKNEKPVPGNLWEEIKSVVKSPREAITQHITDRDKWNECKKAARDVLNNKNPWEPPQKYLGADTYQHWCSAPEYYKPECDKRLVSAPQSKCWFELEEVLLETEGEPLPAGRKHVFYRRVTIEEARIRVKEPPPKICEGLRTWDIVREAWKDWIETEEKRIVDTPPAQPELKKPEPKNGNGDHGARPRHKKNPKHFKKSKDT